MFWLTYLNCHLSQLLNYLKLYFVEDLRDNVSFNNLQYIKQNILKKCAKFFLEIISVFARNFHFHGLTKINAASVGSKEREL